MAVLVVVLCVAAVCESAAISKQQRDTAADQMTRWLHGLAMKTRYIVPTTKRLVHSAQKRRRAVSINAMLS